MIKEIKKEFCSNCKHFNFDKIKDDSHYGKCYGEYFFGRAVMQTWWCGEWEEEKENDKRRS